MKLHYFEKASNFGDALNPWLWPRLLPDFFDDDESSIFVGIGTGLNTHLPVDPVKVIFGAGVGYGVGLPNVDERWRIYCVRGPRSAEALGLDPELAITDAAALLGTLDLAPQAKRYPVAFMPHWESLAFWDWPALCERAGVHLIDPLAPVDTVLAEIARAELLLTEAMHGAIIADVLRVPWIPIQCYEHILEFKWLDWCDSLQLEYRPVRLPSVYTNDSPSSPYARRVEFLDCKRSVQLVGKLSGRLQDGVLKAMCSSIGWYSANEAQARARAIEERLARIAREVEPSLSRDRDLARATERLQERLELLRRVETPRSAVARLTPLRFG